SSLDTGSVSGINGEWVQDGSGLRFGTSGSISNLTINGATGPSLYVNLAGANPSSTGQPTQMVATATVATSPPSLGTAYPVPNITLPSDISTLDQAAAALHFTGFDWVQQITQWVNPNLFANSDPQQLHPITTANGPFYDPVAGGFQAPPRQ